MEEALRKASETFRPTPLETRLYRWLGRCARLAIAAFIASFVANAVGLPFSVVVALGTIFVAAGAAATLLSLVNLSLVVGAMRQRRVVNKIGLHTVSRSAWKAERRRHVGGWIGGAALTTVGAVSTDSRRYHSLVL